MELLSRREILVVDAERAGMEEQATMARGVPSRALMQRAGAAAAAEIARRYPDALRSRGATVYVGGGNNGGDGWVVARALLQAGVRVRVHRALEPRSEDARAECALLDHGVVRGVASPEGESVPAPSFAEAPGGEAALAAASGVHVDALLGTGARGAPSGPIAVAVERLQRARAQGGVVVALDVPTGVDASTGRVAGVAVHADLTLTFGTMKRGLLVAREHAGEIAVLDIGLAPYGVHAATPRLVTDRFVAERVPPIGARAHKGDRGRLLVVGGGEGMVGAAVFAARAAYRSGIGLVRLCVAPANVSIVQQLVPEAIAVAWPASDDAAAELARWANVLLVGPGLGRSGDTRVLVERLLSRASIAPLRLVVDADALNVFEGEAHALATLLRGHEALVTPHPLELGRLGGLDAADVDERRFEVGADLARRLGATVLLKGVPTVVHPPDDLRSPLASATGTPALAVGGSGDLLAGMCGTLLHRMSALDAAACAAWAHGRAAELANVHRATRGITLGDVEARIADAWPTRPRILPYPVLTTLPPV